MRFRIYILLLMSGVILLMNAQAQTLPEFRIAFTARSGQDVQNHEIYIMDSNGENIRRLTDHPNYDGDPTWSPDGQKIAFTSLRDGNTEIYVMDADGNNVRRLTRSGGSIQPAWSPDGEQIAFVARPGTGNEIMVMDANGDRPRALRLPFKWVYSPAWSPDGQTIAFATLNEIHLVDINRGDLRPLAGMAAPPYLSTPSWSPDGKQMAFVSERDVILKIYVVDVDGENLRKVLDTPQSDMMPAWSPDGREIVFVKNDGVIHAVDLDGKNVRSLLVQGQDPDCSLPELAVSPAGRRMTTWGWLRRFFMPVR